MGWLLLLPLFLAAPSEPLSPAGERLVPADMRITSDRELSAAMARVFVDTLIGGHADLLAELGSDPFTFDGRVITGRDAIEAVWKDLLARHGRGLERVGSPTLEALDYPQALERFGKPPKKLAHLPLAQCWYSVVTFPRRPGLMLVLAKGKQANEGWLVTGVTE